MQALNGAFTWFLSHSEHVYSHTIAIVLRFPHES